MLVKYLGKEVSVEANNLKNGLNFLKNIDSDFRSTFIDEADQLKWNCIIAKNNTVLDCSLNDLETILVSSSDEIMVMLQLSGG